MLAGLLGLAILTMTLFPETRLGRSLHVYLVERPLDLAGRLERKQLLLILILLTCSQSLIMVGGIELGLAYAAHMSIYVDAVLMSYVAALATRYASARTIFKAIIVRAVSRPIGQHRRARRTRPALRKSSKPANDDGPAGLVFAVAA